VAATERPRLIVGIGASAGGLNAFKSFFGEMPADTGMAFVLVQHLDPTHKSLLVDLLAGHTEMPVLEATDGAAVQANEVYVIPPDATLCIKHGALEVLTPAPPRQRRRPIDSFFISLAEDQGENAVCVVLSGSGSDGSIGLRSIKEHGGLCLAQAEFDATAMSGMPDSAAATGLVDFVLPVGEMPAKLIEYRQHLAHVAGHKDGDGNRHDMRQHIAAITAQLHARTGHDFGLYKEKTLTRRIQRRMQVLQIGGTVDYLEHLRKDRSESEALYRDLLIGVTQFFRDANAFEALQTTVMPKLLERLASEPDHRIRIWVPGCATGEEVYSIAIILQEALQERGLFANAQIFGTDIDDKAVAVARAGRYNKAMTGISPERLKRWFAQDGEEFCPVKQIRDMCIFTQHSLTKDPPFSKVDLISCRNVLIYMSAPLQDKVLHTFHYALLPDGYLFMGPAEGVTRNTNLFHDIDKKHRVFQRRENGTVPQFQLIAKQARTYPSPPGERPSLSSDDRIEKVGRRIMEKYSPAYVIVDSHDHILRFSGGELGPYLQPASGKASLDLFSVLRKSLRPSVEAALKSVRSGELRAAHENVATKVDHQTQVVSLIVEPIPERVGPGHCIVAFRTLESTTSPSGATPAADAVVQSLEQELRTTKAQLMAAIDELETSTEEMKSANEEYQSVNEEMQATNEELETSKEEMQSINEELQSLNDELHSKNEELLGANSDLKNLIASSHIATIFLDSELRIRNFTPPVEELFNVRGSDRGRPLTDLVSKLNYADLQRDVQKVLRTLSPIEKQVGLADKSESFLMRIRPYLTVTNILDGVVITFIDITERHKDELHRRLLLNELNHRVKNTLSTVISIATQTLKRSPAPEDFQQAFMPRILALSRTHDLLTQSEWRPVMFKELALLELAPYQVQGKSRWTLKGHDILLRPGTILSLGLGLHELATNAAKYGALSSPEGLVELKWDLRQADGERRLHIVWNESGGPEVHTPSARGFGSRLIQAGLAHELGATVNLDFDAAGVRCTIEVPLVEAEGVS
jgi:two-component system CheB/CheR fusion protein